MKTGVSPSLPIRSRILFHDRGNRGVSLERLQFRKSKDFRISSLSFSLFTRRYWGNHCCFLFLRLLICLNSAGSLAWVEVYLKKIDKKNDLKLEKFSFFNYSFYFHSPCAFHYFKGLWLRDLQKKFGFLFYFWVTLNQAYLRDLSPRCRVHSKTRRFTLFCNSRQLSQFATFFIETGAKISIVESENILCIYIYHFMFWFWFYI